MTLTNALTPGGEGIGGTDLVDKALGPQPHQRTGLVHSAGLEPASAREGPALS